jgi:hypothetical protein
MGGTSAASVRDQQHASKRFDRLKQPWRGRRGLIMDTWQGDFGWEAHARAGRPDLLNYLRLQELTWPLLWSYFNQRGLPPQDALKRCLRLFHQYVSWQFELAGSTAEHEIELELELIDWAVFCLNHGDEVPESWLQAELVSLAESGSVSTRYFEHAYRCFLIAVIRQRSREWAEGGCDPASAPMLEDVTSCSGYGLLQVYVPEDAPDLPFAQDARWQGFKRAIAQEKHDLWCASYAALIERLDDMFDERPGL